MSARMMSASEWVSVQPAIPTKTHATGPQNVIEAQTLHRIYETQAGFLPALRGVSLSIIKGEFVCIMGPSGSGKSTLMNILGCLDKPTYGSYRLEGLDVSALSESELAEIRATRLGFVFQSFNLLPRASVLRNVMLPLLYSSIPVREREWLAYKALQAVQLDEKFYAHRSNELSGGQIQRVAIARALVNNPAIVLADEPTGNLDSVTGTAIMQTLDRMHKKGTTIVLITHDPQIAAWADRILYIRDGKLVTPPDDITLYDKAAHLGDETPHDSRRIAIGDPKRNRRPQTKG